MPLPHLPRKVRLTAEVPRPFFTFLYNGAHLCIISSVN
jgi:hypothetical protein